MRKEFIEKITAKAIERHRETMKRNWETTGNALIEKPEHLATQVATNVAFHLVRLL